MTDKKNIAKAEASPPSENEGQIVGLYGQRYLIQDGRRVWLSKPPADTARDLQQ